MKTLTLGALVMTLSIPGLAAGQSKTLPGEMVTVKAKVEAIESESRTINLRMDDGRIETIVAPDEMKTFNQIKVGDIVTAKYLRQHHGAQEGTRRTGHQHLAEGR